MEQIIKLVTDEGDLVIDPFVGAGTTVAAAKMLNRNYIGVDIFRDAVKLTSDRPVSVKIQKEEGTLNEAVSKQVRASRVKQCSYMILVRPHIDYLNIFDFNAIPDNMHIIDSYEVEMDELMGEWKRNDQGFSGLSRDVLPNAQKA